MTRCEEPGCADDAVVGLGEQKLCGVHFAQALRDIRRRTDQLSRFLAERRRHREAG